MVENNRKEVNVVTFTKRMIRPKRVQLSRQMVPRQSVYRLADTQCENVCDLRRCHEMHDRATLGGFQFYSLLDSVTVRKKGWNDAFC